jgi:hypothetical protein
MITTRHCIIDGQICYVEMIFYMIMPYTSKKITYYKAVKVTIKHLVGKRYKVYRNVISYGYRDKEHLKKTYHYVLKLPVLDCYFSQDIVTVSFLKSHGIDVKMAS